MSHRGVGFRRWCALALTLLASCLAEVRGATHELRAGPDTTHFGGWSASHPPVLTVHSGDTVRVWTVSGEPGGVPLDLWDVPSELKAVWHTACGAEDGTQPQRDLPLAHCGNPGPHVMTGPVAVVGAKPGDVLMVEVLSATPWVSWGWNAIRTGKGALGKSPAFGFNTLQGSTVVVPIDLETQTCYPPWLHGAAVRFDATGAKPFFGQMGVAPARAKGTISSIVPGPHGGNLDDKHLGPGSTLYFKIETDGALFSAGDGHAVQGDGEFCVTALETSLEGRFRLTVIPAPEGEGGDALGKGKEKGKPEPANPKVAVFANLTSPRAETKTHYLAMAFHEDLEVASEMALVDLITWVVALTGVTHEAAYRTASLVADAGIPQIVNGLKTVRIGMPKTVVHAMRDARFLGEKDAREEL
jgi:acetamidase/formamidase